MTSHRNVVELHTAFAQLAKDGSLKTGDSLHLHLPEVRPHSLFCVVIIWLVVFSWRNEAQVDMVAFALQRVEHGEVRFGVLDAIPRRRYNIGATRFFLFGDIEVAGHGIEKVEKELRIYLQAASQDFDYLWGGVFNDEELELIVAFINQRSEVATSNFVEDQGPVHCRHGCNRDVGLVNVVRSAIVRKFVQGEKVTQGLKFLEHSDLRDFLHEGSVCLHSHGG